MKKRSKDKKTNCNEANDNEAHNFNKKRRTNSLTMHSLPLTREEPICQKIFHHERLEPLKMDNTSIETLLNPLTKENFVLRVFHQKALHISSSNSSSSTKYTNIRERERTKELRETMIDLDLQQMIEQTSSDNIFIGPHNTRCYS